MWFSPAASSYPPQQLKSHPIDVCVQVLLPTEECFSVNKQNCSFRYRINPLGFFIFLFFLQELLCSHCLAFESRAIKNSCLQQMRHVTLHSNKFPLWPRSQVKFVTMAHTNTSAARNRVRIHRLIYSWSFRVFPLDYFHICDIICTSIWNQSIALDKDSNSSHGCEVFSQAAAEVSYIKVHLFFLFL